MNSVKVKVTKRDNQVVKLDPGQMREQGYTNYNGWSCNAGSEIIHIDFNGDILNCVQRVGGVKGNIYGEIELESNPITCTSKICNCYDDLLVGKNETS